MEADLRRILLLCTTVRRDRLLSSTEQHSRFHLLQPICRALARGRYRSIIQVPEAATRRQLNWLLRQLSPPSFRSARRALRSTPLPTYRARSASPEAASRRTQQYRRTAPLFLSPAKMERTSPSPWHQLSLRRQVP